MTDLLFTFTLFCIGVGALLFGITYAVYIYYRPPRSGHTFLSVILGVGVTLIFIMLGQITVLLSMDVPFYRWYPILIPSVMFLLTGGPMALGQELKRRRQLRRNDELLGEVDSTDDAI